MNIDTVMATGVVKLLIMLPEITATVFFILASWHLWKIRGE